MINILNKIHIDLAFCNNVQKINKLVFKYLKKSFEGSNIIL